MTETPVWLSDAACKGHPTELFFPGPGEPASYWLAVAVCDSCQVRQPCLEDALSYPEGEDFGVRGGVSANVRRHMRSPRLAPSCGTAAKYVQGCRCGRCRDANAAKNQRWRMGRTA